MQHTNYYALYGQRLAMMSTQILLDAVQKPKSFSVYTHAHKRTMPSGTTTAFNCEITLTLPPTLYYTEYSLPYLTSICWNSPAKGSVIPKDTKHCLWWGFVNELFKQVQYGTPIQKDAHILCHFCLNCIIFMLSFFSQIQAAVHIAALAGIHGVMEYRPHQAAFIPQPC